jgi:hypothetical protein
MSRTHRSTARKLSVSLAVLAGVGSFVSFGVFSSFSDTKTNSASLKTAVFGLTQTPSSFLSSLTDLVPGDSITRCIKVTNASDVAASVVASPNFDAGALNPVLRIIVENGSGLSAIDGTCTGFTGAGTYAMGTSAAGVAPSAMSATSAASWAASSSKEYKITITVPSGTTNTDQNKTGSVGFDWTGTAATGGAR